MLTEVSHFFPSPPLWRQLASRSRQLFHARLPSHASPVHCAVREASTSSTKTGTSGLEENDDPVALLRRMQTGYGEKSAQSGEQVSSPLPRRLGKDVSEMNPNASTTKTPTRPGLTEPDEDEPKEAPTSRMDPSPRGRSPLGGGPRRNNDEGQRKPTARNPFIEKLSQMEAKSHLPSFPTYDATAEARQAKIQQKVREERKRMLVFRNVGMELDIPILSRDVFLIFKYFYYGTEFAIDNELERMLRYFNEDALNELKIIEDSKLMRGPSTLSRRPQTGPAAPSSVFSSPGEFAVGEGAAGAPGGPLLDGPARISRVHAGPAGGAVPSPTFPSVVGAIMRHFCAPFDAAVYRALRDALRAGPSKSVLSGFLSAPDAAPRTFSDKDASLFTTLSPRSFRRPALVIYSQLGQKFGSTADAMWRRLAYRSICPALLAAMPAIEAEGADAAKRLMGSKSPPSPPSFHTHSGPTTTISHRGMPIDVLSLRSMDLYAYKWVHRLYVRRFAQFLSGSQGGAKIPPPDKKEDDRGDSVLINNALLASTTFVGTKMLEPFFPSFGLRNYICPYAMLVDHEGVVRWISGGCPDAYEEAHFPGLLRQLENEYFRKNTAH